MLAGATVRFAHLLMDFQLLPSQERHEESTMPCLFAVGHHFWVQTQDEDKQLAKPEMKIKLAIFGKYHHILKEREAKQIQTSPVNRKSKITSLFNQRYFIRALGDHILCVSFAQPPAASSPKQSKNGGICHRKLSCCIMCCSIFF